MSKNYDTWSVRFKDGYRGWKTSTAPIGARKQWRQGWAAVTFTSQGAIVDWCGTKAEAHKQGKKRVKRILAMRFGKKGPWYRVYKGRPAESWFELTVREAREGVQKVAKAVTPAKTKRKRKKTQLKLPFI